MRNSLLRFFQPKFLPGRLLLISVGIVFAAGMGQATASPPLQTAPAGAPLHPTFPLLDADGENVLAGGRPLSTMRTCGTCHDTTYIESHSFHADLGLGDFVDGPGAASVAGTASNPVTSTMAFAQPWDLSSGIFGKWDPLTYRYLSPAGAERIDLTTADWLRQFGARVPGGGPATTARNGAPLSTLPAEAGNVEPASSERNAQELPTDIDRTPPGARQPPAPTARPLRGARPALQGSALVQSTWWQEAPQQHARSAEVRP